MNSQGLPIPASRGLFVAGTDTGAGKTLVSCLLVEAYRLHGLRVAAMKPVAAGVDDDSVNEDVKQLMAASNVSMRMLDVNPYCFAPPIAPHIAARREGIEIDLALISEAFARLRDRSDMVIVEGAGGLLVPLGGEADMSAIPKTLELPVLLVVGMKLGCINHALLTAEAIAVRGLTFAGWIANHIDPEMEAFEENLETLRTRLPAPCLGVLPRFSSPAERGMGTACVSLDLLRSV